MQCHDSHLYNHATYPSTPIVEEEAKKVRYGSLNHEAIPYSNTRVASLMQASLREKQ